MTSPVVIHFSIDAPSQEDIDRKFIEYLRDRGYHVAEPNEAWETLAEFMRRNRLRKNESFHAALTAWEARGHKILRLVGKSGRIIELLSNPAFDAFCRRNKR